MRFYCIKKVYKYFREYVESIKMPKDKVIIFEEKEKLEIEDDGITNIFLSFIPNLNNIIFNNKNNNVINLFYFNTEQFTREEIRGFVLQNIRNLINLAKNIPNLKISIADYSEQNIKLMKNTEVFDELNLKIYHLPYQYNPAENKKLEKFSKSNKLYDFAFSGCLSDYRKKIMNEIQTQNMLVNIVDGFYNERDLEIGKCKVLLNIHYNKNYNIYESLRCDRWIFSENLVLTEISYDNNSLDLKDFMISTDYDSIPLQAKRIIDRIDLYKKFCFSIRKKILLQEVIDKRREIYNEFRNEFN